MCKLAIWILGGGLSLNMGCYAEIYTSYELGIFGCIFISGIGDLCGYIPGMYNKSVVLSGCIEIIEFGSKTEF